MSCVCVCVCVVTGSSLSARSVVMAANVNRSTPHSHCQGGGGCVCVCEDTLFTLTFTFKHSVRGLKRETFCFSSRGSVQTVVCVKLQAIPGPRHQETDGSDRTESVQNTRRKHTEAIRKHEKSGSYTPTFEKIIRLDAFFHNTGRSLRRD